MNVDNNKVALLLCVLAATLDAAVVWPLQRLCIMAVTLTQPFEVLFLRVFYFEREKTRQYSTDAQYVGL